jgi:hypothetical protein
MLTYHDDGGDTIALSSDAELREAISIAVGGNSTSLLVMATTATARQQRAGSAGPDAAAAALSLLRTD